MMTERESTVCVTFISRATKASHGNERDRTEEKEYETEGELDRT